MSETNTDIPVITSLAAPTEADMKALRAMTPEQRRALIAAEIEKGTRDIVEGRYVLLQSDEDITKFFDDKWPI